MISPGCLIQMHGPPEGGTGIVVVDARSVERRFVPYGTKGLVIGVECFNARDPIFTTYVYVLSPKAGFFRVSSTRVRVLYDPSANPP